MLVIGLWIILAILFVIYERSMKRPLSTIFIFGTVTLFAILGTLSALGLGWAASTRTVEISRVKLIPYDVLDFRGEPAYLFTRETVEPFFNGIKRDSWIKYADESGNVTEHPVDTTDRLSRCDDTVVSQVPVMVTYRKILLYPQMKWWVLFSPRYSHCFSPSLPSREGVVYIEEAVRP